MAIRLYYTSRLILVLDKSENLYPFSGNPENDGIAFEYKVADISIIKIYRLTEAIRPVWY